MKLRLRLDLSFTRQSYLGRDYWVAKDPLSLSYYRFEDEEYCLIKMLDGETSLDQIKRRFERQFAPQKISFAEIHQFVGLLHQRGILISDAAGQGSRLIQRAKENASRRFWASATNILMIRIRGFDPDGILDWLNKRIGWFFSTPALLVCLLFTLSASLLLLVQFDLFRSRLPAFHDFFAFKNWTWLAIVLSVTKILHEFGHGLACKRFGGRSHEMGIMFLVLMPCLYCNVSDSWSIPSKWKRAAIGAAGMYVEIALASLCTFLWWFSHPGFFNYLCLNVMFVCSISTLLFNANPLMRYDGYYILSDLVEIPNLRQKASDVVRMKLNMWMLGIQEPPNPFLPKKRRWLFAAYAMSASVYRWFITFSIFWFLYQMLEPYGMKIIGQGLGLMAIYGLVGAPLIKTLKFFFVPGRIEKVNKIRAATSMVLLSAAIIAVVLIPLPHFVYCSVFVQPRDAATVYVDVPGNIQAIHVQPGDRVEKSSPILGLLSDVIEASIVQTEGELNRLASRRTNLLKISTRDETADLELQPLEKSIDMVRQQLDKLKIDRRKLTVLAPISGTVIAAPSKLRPDQNNDVLPTWDGTPLEPRNFGAWLEPGTMICQIGEMEDTKAMFAINQSDIEFVRKGQTVEIQLDRWPTRLIESRISEISPTKMEEVPAGLSTENGGALITTSDAAGRRVPMTSTFQAGAVLELNDEALLLGAIGNARIKVGEQTVGSRAWRWFCHTFNFKL